jgi:mRNA-degrading endonuclease YafQ of YafQ-DinJ toxin-antitoxin module
LSAQCRIEVITTPFAERRQYAAVVLDAVARRPAHEKCMVFLDPDTGLAPRVPQLEHVLDAELREIWQHMVHRDVLVVYQHQTNQNGTPWIQPKREQFEKALGLLPGDVMVATGVKIAHDVALLFAHKQVAATR